MRRKFNTLIMFPWKSFLWLLFLLTVWPERGFARSPVVEGAAELSSLCEGNEWAWTCFAARLMSHNKKERSGWEHCTAKQPRGTTARPRTPRQPPADDFFPSMFSSTPATTSRLRSRDAGWLICRQRRTRTDSLKSCPSRTTRGGLNPLSLFPYVHELGRFSWKSGEIASQIRLGTRGNDRLCLPHKLAAQW